MSTPTLTRFEVTTVGPKGCGRRTITVAARDKAAAAAAAITAHRASAGLPADASVLTSTIEALPVSELEARRRHGLIEQGDPPDAA